MKPVKFINSFTSIGFLCICLLFSSFQAKPQCGVTLQSKSYSILLNGTGNNLWGFSIPQFDPSIGTLVAVNIQSIVSVNVKFNLYNLSTNADNFTVATGRNDVITVSALGTPITNSFSQNHAIYNLQVAQDTVGAGTVLAPQFFPLLDNYKISDSVVTSVANFLGNNYVSFNYQPQTYVSVTSGSSYNLNNTFSDTMKISLTYYYCTQNVLATDITNFSVIKQGASDARISWQVENETAGRNYQIEESTDGKTFNNIASFESVIESNNSGNYQYTTPINGAPILYFRIKETDADGNYKYSEVKTIDIENNSTMVLSPNPSASFINVLFNQQEIKNWDVEIYASDGRLIQKNYFLNSNNAHISFAKSMAAGVYFIRAVDQQSQKKYTSSFVVR